MAVTKEEIENFRSAFLEDVSTKGIDSIHPNDLQRVKTNDFWLERFLKHNEKNLDMAVQMLWESVTWRKEFKTNEITEDNIKKDIIVAGAFFPYGQDKDGCTLLVFKCIKHKKGQVDMDDLKRCVVYWFERVERENKGQPVSLFFDMEGCGLSNMDMEFTKYLIGLFKTYYPFFLNYILIFEMPWVLSAAFKIIKSWLPEKAIEKIKFVSKKDIKTFVPLEHALECWGGTNKYQFSFIPEEKTQAIESTLPLNNNNKKVHFMDGTPMSDPLASSGDKENDGGNPLKVQPANVITFVKEGSELVSTLSIENSDASICLSYKLKTTSPEKFRVKPSTGILQPLGKATITVSLVAGYHIGGLSKDKFLVMSTILDANDSMKDPTEIWKNSSSRKVNQVRLRCVQSGDLTRAGNMELSNGIGDTEHDLLLKLVDKVSKVAEKQEQMSAVMRKTQYYQIATGVLALILACVLFYVLRQDIGNIPTSSYCTVPPKQ